jgi:hypothetical protein
MGLSFHNNGRFDPGASLREMTEEVEDVVKIYGWPYLIFGTTFPKDSLELQEYDGNLYGICFSPPKCEPVFLSFLSNGRMCSADGLKAYASSVGRQEEQHLYTLSTKTQYAGYNTHKIIMELLKYLSKKYFRELNVVDEGRYWQTGDELVLKNIFNTYEALISGFAEVLESFPAEGNETIESYKERMMDYFAKRRKSGKG